MNKYFIFIVMCLAGEPSPAKTQLVLATYHHTNNDRVANLHPLAKVIGKQFNMPTQINSYSTEQELIAAIHRNEVDIAFVSTFGYMLLENSSESPMTPLVKWDGIGVSLGPVLISKSFSNEKQHALKVTFKRLATKKNKVFNALKENWPEAIQARGFTDMETDGYKQLTQAFGVNVPW